MIKTVTPKFARSEGSWVPSFYGRFEGSDRWGDVRKKQQRLKRHFFQIASLFRETVLALKVNLVIDTVKKLMDRFSEIAN